MNFQAASSTQISHSKTFGLFVKSYWGSWTLALVQEPSSLLVRKYLDSQCLQMFILLFLHSSRCFVRYDVRPSWNRAHAASVNTPA